jgi:Glycosyl transferase family 2
VPDVAFVMSPRQHYPLRELAATLEYELALQSVPATLYFGGFPTWRPNRVYVLMGPREYLELEGEDALPDDAVLKRTIFIGAEDPDAIGGDEVGLELLRRAGAVFDLNQRTVLALRRQGIPARTLTPGYSAHLDHFDPDAPRPIDVMFYGRHSPRRSHYLAHWADLMARRNCLLRLADRGPHPGDTSSFLAQGRWALLAQTKVLVCLHREEQPYFEWPRAIDAIHTGAVVVSEHSSGIAPLEAGEHLLVGSADSLPFLVDALLHDEARLARLRVQAYKRLSEWLPSALHVAVLRAAIVELVGEPVPPGTSMGVPGSHRQDHRFSRDPNGPGPNGESWAIRREVYAFRRELVEVRRRVTLVEETIRSAAGTRPIRLAFETAAWAARRNPRVTAIVTFDDEGQPLLSTLDSLAESWLRDVELVVVARGADRDGDGVASRWLRGHPRIAARLVLQSVDRGLGAARNVGLDFARGRYCLAVDRGQEVQPRCLAVLAGTLDAMPDVAFVYPIQEVTWAADAVAPPRSDHLVNFLGWDPERLRAWNYIHAPALIRANRLREMGGFATSLTLDGDEDYDLWCRMAARLWEGLGVPQILVRRREGPFSSSLATMRPARFAVETVLERTQSGETSAKSPRSVRKFAL